MSGEHPLVYVIVLNWNRWPDTAECLQSCRGLTYPRYRLLLVDNGSTDGSEARLRALFPDLEILQTGENLGFAGGNNAGIHHALDRGAEYVWLLNNDAVVDPAALNELVAVAHRDARVGVAGSKILYYGDPQRLNCAGGRISRLTGFPYNRGRGALDRGQFDRVEDVDYVLGCSCLIRAEAMRHAGLMDHRFFLYFEDAEWNFRLRRRGWRLVLAPRSVVWHKEAQSTGLHSPRMVYYFARNSLLFAQQAMPWVLPLTLLRDLQVFVWGLWRRGEGAKARMGCLGILDFFRRRFGPSAYV